MQIQSYNNDSRYCSVSHGIYQCTAAIKQYSEAIAITTLNYNKEFKVRYRINHFLIATTVYVLQFSF